MRRVVVAILLAVCLIPGAAGAGSAGRTVERAYEPAYVEPGGPPGTISHSNGVTFRTKAGERFVTITIEDDSGLPTPARVTQGAAKHPDHEYDVDESFCGSTSEPIAIQGGAPVTVWMSHGTCEGLANPAGVGGWTTGTVTATFSKA